MVVCASLPGGHRHFGGGSMMVVVVVVWQLWWLLCCGWSSSSSRLCGHGHGGPHHYSWFVPKTFSSYQ
jgi:hypothetical protein